LRNPHVLFISDDGVVCRLLFILLQEQGIDATLVTSPEAALTHWHEGCYDLLVIDVEDVSLSGVEICYSLRAEVISPILLVAHEGDERAIMTAYEAGIDDYLVKPLGLRLYSQKIIAWLRHARAVPAHLLRRLELASFVLDAHRRQLQLLHEDGKVVHLTNLEFRLLHLLMSHEGQILETDFLLDRLWGSLNVDGATALKSVVYRVRRKIEPIPKKPRFLQTVAGRGYVFRIR